MSKCRVRRTHNHGPRLAQALFLGTLLGVLTRFTAPLTLLNFGWQWFDIPGWFFLQFLAPLVILALFQRYCRHRVWSFLMGGTMVATFNVSLLVFPVAGYVFGATPAEMWTNALIVFLFGSVIGGVLNLALNYLKDFLWGEVVTQDGTMCPTCAYNILHLPGPRCPECGKTFELEDLDPNPPDRACEWRRFAFQFFSVAFVCTLGYLALPSLVFRLAANGWYDVVPVREYLTLRPGYSRDILLTHLKNGDAAERATAAYCLLFVLTPEYGGIAADSETMLALKTASMIDPIATVRQSAIQTVSMMSSDSLHEILEQLVLDSDATVRWIALAHGASAGIVDNRGTPFLIRALTDEDVTVRDHAYQRLTANTGQSFPYDPSAPLESRLEAQARWQAWWNAQQENKP